MGEIRALCLSEKRGTEKQATDRAFFITEYGIDGDAHAGDWHRQVSLLGLGECGGNAGGGAFGGGFCRGGFLFRDGRRIAVCAACRRIFLDIVCNAGRSPV